MEGGTSAAGKNTRLRYGFCGWTPNCFQRLCSSGIFFGFVYFGYFAADFSSRGIIVVIIGDLETRFALSSSQSSWIIASYEIAAVVSTFVLSIIGSRYHRPRIIGLGLFLVGLGTLLFALPQFLIGVYNPSPDFQLCSSDDNSVSNSTSLSCKEPQSLSSLHFHLIFFIISRVLCGIGHPTLQLQALFYLDDVLTKEKFAFNLGFVYMASLLGLATSFSVGGMMLNKHTDFYRIDLNTVYMSPMDRQWMGAWWPFYLVIAIFLFLLAFGISGYPDDLPGASAIRASKISEAHVTESEQKSTSSDISLSSIKLNVLSLAKNPVYVAIVVYQILHYLIAFSLGAFGPRFMVNQYGLSSSKAGLYFGIAAVIGGSVGSVLSGTLIRCLKLNLGGILQCMVAVNIVLAMTLSGCLLRCEKPHFNGVHKEWNENEIAQLDKINRFDFSCNTNCSCNGMTFTPLCGANGEQYYSPCHAGCQHRMNDVYHNCSCVVGQESSTATLGSCSASFCWQLPVFLITFAINTCMSYLSLGFSFIAVLRCVAGSQRSAAVGISNISRRLFGGTFGPILMGRIFDASCSLWDDVCDSRGSCLDYKSDQLGLHVSLSAGCLQLVAIFSTFLAWFLYKSSPMTKKLSSAQIISDQKINASVSKYVSEETITTRF